MNQCIHHYIDELNKTYTTDHATEHSYRPALQRLLENMTQGLKITNEPKHIACGAPDYIVSKNDIPVGYIEAKDIGVDLNGKANREQFERYKQSLHNLIITDYLTFQLFEEGGFVVSATIAQVGQNGMEADPTQFETFASFIERFTDYKGYPIQTSEDLSKVMAAKARLMASIIEQALNSNEKPTGNYSLNGQLEGFRKVLIPDITPKAFADIYAQTIAYGMFAARLNDKTTDTFTRGKAAQLIPQSNPFLRKLFQYIAGYELDERIRWVVDVLADLFNHVDTDAIIKEFGKIEHDPIIHFYETFLAEYDPALRKSRGVWYTPQAVVQFIVQAVDELLKQEFGLPQGLADASKLKLKQHIKQKDGSLSKEEKEYHRVQILDPATGTGTFLAEVVNNIYKQFKDQQGMWSGYANEHLIPRINGFEILMASYAMAHLKLDMLLHQTGYKPANDNQRLRIYLTNSLEKAHAKTDIPFAKWLSDEANEASSIKQDVPVMVVMGNPPYSGKSQNNGEWIEKLMLDYKKEPSGIKLQERNPKWINDDYVKFIRYGQYFVEKNGEGILAYINNHSFLDNPTFRGMRWHLLQTFDTIYIVDLHGNAKKKETAPDGSKDENVFDIQQGVSINIFVKTGRNKTGKPKVFHYDLYGKRKEKYNFLLNNNLRSVKWRELELNTPQYFFVAKDFSLQKEYEQGFSVKQLFPINSSGIVTAKDAVFINTHKKELITNVKNHFNIKPDETLIHKINYRPFDNQYIYYDIKKLEGARENVMQHFLKGENVGVMLCRQQKTNGFYHCLVHKNIVESSFVSNKTSEIGYSFPLYLYLEGEIVNGKRMPNKKTPNLNESIVSAISQRIGLSFTEIDLLDYIYAVLHSPSYRERYREFLKIDFPRVPYPKDAAQFRALADLGAKLRRLHLMEGVEPLPNVANYPKEGDNKVEKSQYTNGKVWINDTQYFDNVPPEAWAFYIGGYQPAQKWLKDRKKRVLEYEDLQHYRRIIYVLQETGKVMKEIDNISLI